MKVSYRGIQSDLPVKLQEKLDARFAKLSKLVDGRGEKKARVVVSTERHLHKAEITVLVHERQLVGLGSDADLFTALITALGKLEKQILNEGEKWRATTRRGEPMKAAASKAAPAAPKRTAKATRSGSKSGGGTTPRVFASDGHERRKPITLEEAMLQMEDGRDYLVYRDADKQSVSMLVRRRDGHFDLIES